MKTATISQLAELFELDRRTVVRKLGDLAPISDRGNKGKYYRVADAARLCFAPEALDLSQERARLAKWQADHEEIKVSIVRGELFPAPAIVATWQSIVAAARAKLLGIPRRMAPLVVEAGSLAEIEATARDLIYEALAELARGGDGLPANADPDGSSAGDLEPTAKPDSQSVGRRKSRAKRGGGKRAGKVEH